MTDLSTAIVPKSDQLNADDLIAGPKTIRISRVEIRTGEQPVSIFFDGDNGKPWKPCKSMLRALVHVWGVDSTAYAGRALTLVLDPAVIWAGKPVGGIRISHMSDLGSESVTFALTDKKGSRKPFTVKLLTLAPAFDRAAALAKLEVAALLGSEALAAEWGRTKGQKLLADELPRLKQKAAETLEAAAKALAQNSNQST